MIAVCNTSPISSLIQIGHLALLEKLHPPRRSCRGSPWRWKSTIALLIIDDLPGRRIATTLGLRCTGTVGLLVTSKRAGYLARIAPLLDDLRVRARFWISDDVIRRALELAGE
jgi:predicted nucleic acid-binding protein